MKRRPALGEGLVLRARSGGISDIEAMRISCHKARTVFVRDNVVIEADLQNAAAKVTGLHREAHERLERDSPVTKWAQP